MADPKRTLLAVGNEEEWARINDEEREALVPPADTPIEELLRAGVRLSAQALRLLKAVERSSEGRTASGA